MTEIFQELKGGPVRIINGVITFINGFITAVITLLIGVISPPFATGFWGPPCIDFLGRTYLN